LWRFANGGEYLLLTNMKKILIAILSTLLSVLAFAQNPGSKKNYHAYLVMGNKDANIEIVEANDVTLKHRTWGSSEERKFSLRAYAKIARDKWTTVKFKIKYTGKTPVYFVFGGEGESVGEKTLCDCVLYDNVKIIFCTLEYFSALCICSKQLGIGRKLFYFTLVNTHK
jgi:hypothetical protein